MEDLREMAPSEAVGGLVIPGHEAQAGILAK
jgi:hypothetical protein